MNISRPQPTRSHVTLDSMEIGSSSSLQRLDATVHTETVSPAFDERKQVSGSLCDGNRDMALIGCTVCVHVAYQWTRYKAERGCETFR